MTQTQTILLVRHGEVESRWKGICYGAMDVALSEAGERDSSRLAAELAKHESLVAVYHSGLSRTRFLANQIAASCTREIPVHEDVRLRERDYGDWQGMTWDAAYGSDPENFHGLIEQPDTYRPPAGETTSEMQHRVVDWLRGQPEAGGTVIAVSHSGPIAALAGHLLGLKPTAWTPWMTKNLQVIPLVREGATPTWKVQEPDDRETS